jgi:hypothetical protein
MGMLLSILSLQAGAQKLSKDPLTFPTEVNAMMTATNVASCIADGNAFAATWSTFSAAQQKSTMDLTEKMIKSKKYRTNPHYADFFGLLASLKTKGFSDQVDSFLIITNAVLETYDAKQLQGYFKTLRMVYEQKCLFYSTFNRLWYSGTPRLVFVDPYAAAVIEETVVEETVIEETQQEEVFENLEEEYNYEEEYTEDAVVEEYVEEEYIPYPPQQPDVIGAVIRFSKTDLLMVTPYDSVSIEGTMGDLRLSDQHWIGKGGKFSWASAGLPEAYCMLNVYNFPAKSYSFTSEVSKLYYPAKTDSAVLGIFGFNSVKGNPQQKAYPKFISYKSNIPVKNIGPNIRYTGGLSLSGRKLYSSALDEGRSVLEVMNGDKPILKAASPRLLLSDSLLSADYALVTLFLAEDSIFHPGTTFKYNQSTRKLRVEKSKGFRGAPFLDSYHQIEIQADAMIWDMNTMDIDFQITSARTEVPAVFESTEYFNQGRYTQFQGLYPFHPIGLVVAQATRCQCDQFSVLDLAAGSKQSEKALRPAMADLMKEGFIDYNSSNGMITVRNKCKHYVQSRKGKKDYDNIIFYSQISNAPNATLHLDSLDLEVRGVQRVYISDSLAVNIEPDSQVVHIQKNRDFNFNGKINTANFQFIGTDMQFNYDSFLVHMPVINEIKLAVADTAATNKDSKSKVLGNELRFSSGTLYINKPDNKSGKIPLPEYPIFNARTGAKVFFDKDAIANGVYDTTVQFEIPPFIVDSLSSDNPDAIGFDGTFKSGGIFPDFEEKLVVMPDRSLGFKHVTPKAGYPLYQGKGKFYEDIKLDLSGIKGNGYIKYLNTTLYSSDFMFYQDSVLTVGSTTETVRGPNKEISPEVTFPDVQLKDYKLKWVVSADSMNISNLKEPMKLYDSTAKMIGTTVVSEKGMLGLGVLLTRGSESETREFNFHETTFEGRHASFLIRSDNPEKPALRSKDVRLFFDLAKGEATFSPEVSGVASIEFPYAQYKTSIEQGRWDLKEKKVYMTAEDSTNITSSYFYSIRPDQDSLVFNASKAVYEIDYLTLSIFGVPYIRVADAYVYPDSNTVYVRENAVMKTLYKTKIEMDTLNKFHYLERGVIDIYGRKKFNGEAVYLYKNKGGDTMEILFSNFKYVEGERKKDGAYTVSRGIIEEADSVFLGPKLLYRGNVTLYSHEQFLTFDGFLKLDLRGALSYSEWLKFVNNGTGNIDVEINTAVSASGKPLTSGLYFDKNSSLLYTNFLSVRHNEDDPAMMACTDRLEYDRDSITKENKFIIGSLDHYRNKTHQGNYIAYNDDSSTTHFAGKFDLMREHPNVKLLASGIGNSDIQENHLSTRMFMAFNPGNANPLKYISLNTATLAGALPQAEEDFSPKGVKEKERDEELLFDKLGQLIGEEGVKEYKSKRSMQVTPLYSLNSEFVKGLVIEDVEMRWSSEQKAFYSVGEIKLASVLKVEVNRKVRGMIEIKKTGRGDVITIVLELMPNVWYFFNYEDNRLAVLTYDDVLNATLAKKTKGEMPDRTKFFWVVADLMEKKKFELLFSERYRGIDLNEQEEQRDSLSTDSTQNDSYKRNKIETQDGPSEEEQLERKNQGDVNEEFDKDANYDQYKIDDPNYKEEDQQRLQEEAERKELERKKAENDAERQRQSQQEQERMRNLIR